MNELANSLNFIIKYEINKVLDNISIKYNINRSDLNEYTNVDEEISEYEKNSIINNANDIIEIPSISSDDEDIQNSNNSKFKMDNKLEIKEDDNLHKISNTSNLKCKQMTRKGKQCEYNCKANSEYCGRHSK